MENQIAPEITGYAEKIIKSVIGERVQVKSFRWSREALLNKVYCIDTNEGSYILKIERDKIFPSTRKGQIENEVEGSRLYKQAGILCPSVIKYDLTGREIGVRYILTECLSDDWPVISRIDQMDVATKTEVKRQATEICVRILTITNTHFGSLSPSGSLGRHKTWDECYRAWFNLLIRDGVSYGLFTDQELDVLYAAAEMPLNYSGNPVPVFSTEDMGWHNFIWGNAGGEPDALYSFDFGNARYIPPYRNEYLSKNIEAMGRPPWDIPEFQNMDKGYNMLLLDYFEGLLRSDMKKLTEGTSRKQVMAFVEKCRAVIQSN